MLVIAGTITLDPAKRAIIDAAFEKMRTATLQEPGCIEYQCYVDRNDPGTVFMFEKWESQDALSAHFVSPHMAEFGKAMGEAGVTGMDLRKYEVSKEGPAL